MNNYPLHIEFQVLCHVGTSSAESKLGALFHNVQITIALRTKFEEIIYQQPPTPIETYNFTALGIANSSVKQKNPNQWAQ